MAKTVKEIQAELDTINTEIKALELSLTVLDSKLNAELDLVDDALVAMSINKMEADTKSDKIDAFYAKEIAKIQMSISKLENKAEHIRRNDLQIAINNQSNNKGTEMTNTNTNTTTDLQAIVSPRDFNILSKDGITTVAQLEDKTSDEVLAIENTCKSFITRMTSKGIKFNKSSHIVDTENIKVPDTALKVVDNEPVEQTPVSTPEPVVNVSQGFNKLELEYVKLNDLIIKYNDEYEVLCMQKECDIINASEFNTKTSSLYSNFDRQHKVIKYAIFMASRNSEFVSNVPELDLPVKPEPVQAVFATNEHKSLTELITTVEACYDSIGADLPYNLKGINRIRRQIHNSSTFGIDVEVLITLARLLNKPFAKDSKWSQEALIENKDIILDTLGLRDEESIIVFLDAMEELRIAYGYHSFILKDEKGLVTGLQDANYPDEVAVESSVSKITKLLNITFDFNIKHFNIGAWDRKEQVALIKVDAELAKDKADKAEMAKLIASLPKS